MQKQKTQKRSLIISLCVLVGIGGSLLFLARKTEVTPKPPIYVVTEPKPTASPVSGMVPATLVSPDGVHVLQLEQTDKVATLLSNNQVVLKKDLVEGEALMLPFNAWSPDNKYFFVEDKQAERSAYVVMRADGTSVADNIVGLFTDAQPAFSLVEVTGWASPTLIVVNAKSDTQSPVSFWFDVQSRKFIRLSTYFN